jgi:hypothetical protein
MARFYKVKIGDIWLTRDGLEAGPACKTDIQGAALLTSPTVGNVAIGSDGGPFRETPLTPDGGGRAFLISVPVMKQDVFEDLRAALDAAAASASDFNVTGSGSTGDFDVDAIVFDNPVYLDFGAFSGDDIKNVKISLITTAINAI